MAVTNYVVTLYLVKRTNNSNVFLLLRVCFARDYYTYTSKQDECISFPKCRSALPYMRNGIFWGVTCDPQLQQKEISRMLNL